MEAQKNFPPLPYILMWRLVGYHQMAMHLLPSLKMPGPVFLRRHPSSYAVVVISFFEQPLKIEVKGSLFYDKQHHNGLIGPAAARPPDAWEIHPVTGMNYK